MTVGSLVMEGSTLVGGALADKLTGSATSDTLHGNGGNDEIDGGAGDDTLHGNAGNDDIDGGDGIDTAVYSGNRADYTITEGNGFLTISGPDGANSRASTRSSSPIRPLMS